MNATKANQMDPVVHQGDEEPSGRVAGTYEAKLRKASVSSEMTTDIYVWDDEGGAPMAPPDPPWPSLTGTESQVEWAERIRARVRDEFERVEKSFRAVAAGQHGTKRARTELILTILEDKRQAVMSRTEAGHFIRDWQEINDQVRQMIASDSRYPALNVARTEEGLSESG